MSSNYQIRLCKWQSKYTLSDFIIMCQEIERSLKRLESTKYYTKLSACEYHQTSIDFKIVLAKN